MDIKSAIEILAKKIDPDQNLIRIGAVGDAVTAADKCLLLSIVNIEGSAEVRNQSVVSHANFQERPLVVSVLFSAVDPDYLRGIEKLQQLINYLENHTVFDAIESRPVIQKTKTIGIVAEAKNGRFTVVPLPLSMEQRSLLWSTLGTVYKPSVLYQLTIHSPF